MVVGYEYFPNNIDFFITMKWKKIHYLLISDSSPWSGRGHPEHVQVSSRSDNHPPSRVDIPWVLDPVSDGGVRVRRHRWWDKVTPVDVVVEMGQPSTRQWSWCDHRGWDGMLVCAHWVGWAGHRWWGIAWNVHDIIRCCVILNQNKQNTKFIITNSLTRGDTGCESVKQKEEFFWSWLSRNQLTASTLTSLADVGYILTDCLSPNN